MSKPIWTIAVGTLRSALSNRILAALVLLDLTIVWIGLVFGFLPKEEEFKIIFDVGLATTALFSMLVGVFVTGWSFPEEIGNRRIYLVLSKPVSRGEFFVGKLGGLVGTSLVATLVMGAFVMAIILFKFKLNPGPALLALYMNALELIVIVSMALLYAIWTGGRSSVLLTIITYFLGHSSKMILSMGEKSHSVILTGITHILYVLLPNLELFNVRHLVTHRLEVPGILTMSATAYALAYSGWVLCLAYRLFLRKEI